MYSSPDDKILHRSKLEAFADKKHSSMIISVFDRIENTVGIGENNCGQILLHFPQCLQNAFATRSLLLRTAG